MPRAEMRFSGNRPVTLLGKDRAAQVLLTWMCSRLIGNLKSTWTVTALISHLPKQSQFHLSAVSNYMG
jgi:hypothetical protein